MAKDYARTDRVAEQIRRELAELVRLEVKDPRVHMITLTGVEVVRDYSHAKVFYTTLEGASKDVQQGLERASGFLRSQLAHVMKLRITPQLHFVYDASVERGAHLSQLIDQAVASDKNWEGRRGKGEG
ncbi:MAG: 30S ribosome-binding factor RbfA [Gallionellaceae bacterium]|nr:30S ribosome-binding factor RbfA [Gallionellaceae bacterium]